MQSKQFQQVKMVHFDRNEGSCLNISIALRMLATGGGRVSFDMWAIMINGLIIA